MSCDRSGLIRGQLYLAGVGPCLEHSAPLGGVTDVLAQVVTPGGVADERVVEGHEHNALPRLGVHHQLPEILGDWDLVIHQVHLSVIDLKH